MKRIAASAPRIRRARRWPEELPDDPRDPDVVRAKALARARTAGSSQASRAAEAAAMRPGITGPPARRRWSRRRKCRAHRPRNQGTTAAIAADNQGEAP